MSGVLFVFRDVKSKIKTRNRSEKIKNYNNKILLLLLLYMFKCHFVKKIYY